MSNKVCFVASGLFLAALSGCGGSSSNDDPNSGSDSSNVDGLVAYYSFDGNANDEQGNNDGTVNGAELTEDRNGVANNAYYFDGDDDRITLPININPDVMPELTITAWVRSDDGEGTVVSHDRLDNASGFERTFTIDTRGGGTGWSAFAGSASQVIGFIPVEVGEWAFVAVIYDQPNERVKFFVNEQSREGAGFLGDGLSVTTLGTNPGFPAEAYFEGAIDEVRFYDRALSDAEIETIYMLE